MEMIRLLIVLSFMFFISCEKNKDEDKTIITCYEETKASDPWTKSENDYELIINIKNFLSDSVKVYDVFITDDGTLETCKAAYCKTGRRIKAKIKSDDLSKIEKLKFYECE